MTVPTLARQPVRRSRLFMGAVGLGALVLAITNSAASVGFPIGAQWERVINALVTVDLLVVFLVLIAAVLIGARRDAAREAQASGVTVVDQHGLAPEAALPTGPGVLAPVGLALVALHWVLWLIFAFPGMLHSLLAHEAGYLLAIVPLVLFAPMLVLGTVFAVIGFHRGGGRANRVTALVGAGAGLLMMALAAVIALLCAVGVLR